MNSFIPIILTFDIITIVLLGIILLRQMDCFSKFKTLPLTKIPSNNNMETVNSYEEMQY